MRFREATKDMTFVQKIAYIWDYYKWFILVGIFLVAVFGNMLYAIAKESGKNYLANVMMINCETYSVDNSTYFRDFLDEYGADDDVFVNVDTTMKIDLKNSTEQTSSNFQTLAAMFISGDVDIFVSDQLLFDKENERHAFEDLRNVFTEERFAELDEAGQIYWAPDADTGEDVPVGLYLADKKICTELYFMDASLDPIVGVGSQWQSDEEDTSALLEYMIR